MIKLKPQHTSILEIESESYRNDSNMQNSSEQADEEDMRPVGGASFDFREASVSQLQAAWEDRQIYLSKRERAEEPSGKSVPHSSLKGKPASVIMMED